MKIKKIVVSLITAVSILGTTVACAFSDVNYSHWAYNQVELMQEKGVISGFEDGTFRPDMAVTREQFASILVKTLGLTNIYSDIEFEDVEEHRWSNDAIKIASSYLTGYQIDNKYYFRPSESAVREDMAVAVVKAKGLENKEPNYAVLNKFSDKDKISEGVKKYVAIAVENEIMNGNSNGTFNPLGSLTRAEITALMYNVMEKVAIDDVIKEEEDKHIHKETKKIVDNEDGTHKIEIYCKDCKEVISIKNEKHKFEQGECECGNNDSTIVNEEKNKEVGLPDFEINEEDSTINLGEEWEKYQIAYGSVNTSMWYTPSSGESKPSYMLPKIEDNKLHIDDIIHYETVESVFIRLKSNPDLGYKKISIPDKIRCEHNWKIYNVGEVVDKKIGGISHDVRCSKCKKVTFCAGCNMPGEYIDNEDNKTHRLVCDYFGETILEEEHENENWFCKKCNRSVKPNLQISHEEITLKVGESFQLSATCYPRTSFDSSITWDLYGDEDVLEIDDNGKITALNSGNVRVSAFLELYGLVEHCFVTVE